MKNKKIILFISIFLSLVIFLVIGIKVYYFYDYKNNLPTGLIPLEEREKINKTFLNSIIKTSSGERIYCIDDECGIPAY